MFLPSQCLGMAAAVPEAYLKRTGEIGVAENLSERGAWLSTSKEEQM